MCLLHLVSNSMDDGGDDAMMMMVIMVPAGELSEHTPSEGNSRDTSSVPQLESPGVHL